jgi:hypothetical protein
MHPTSLVGTTEEKENSMNFKRISLAITVSIVVVMTFVGVQGIARAATVCTPTGSISVPYAKDGVGDTCFQTASLCTYINSWNLSNLEVNGNSYTNTYVASSTIAPVNGLYIIHYVSTVAWAHFEIGGTCSSRPTPTPTRTKTNTPAGPIATSTRTNTPVGPTTTPTRTSTRTNKPVGPTTTPTRTPIGTATSTAIAANCGSLAICDGFESQTVGAAPSGNWQMIYPDCQGTGIATVDSTQAHSGAKSIRIDGKTGYCNHVFFGNTTSIAGIGPVVYGRIFIRNSIALGTDHVTFMAMTDVNDANKNLRFGGQGQVMAWNRESDDATVPSMSPVGISTSTTLPVKQWSCLEFKVDGTNGFLQVWLNGTEVPGLAVDGVSSPDIDAQWKTRTNWHPSLSNVKLGWESYSTGDNTLWFDDVAFGASRIGCGT